MALPQYGYGMMPGQGMGMRAGGRISPLYGGPQVQLAINPKQGGPSAPGVPSGMGGDSAGMNLRNINGLLDIFDKIAANNDKATNLAMVGNGMENVNATMDGVHSLFDLPGGDYFTQIASGPGMSGLDLQSFPFMGLGA